MKFDGKHHPNAGATAAVVAASSIRRLDEHTLQLTGRKSDGKPIDDLRLALSPDLTMLTMTPSSGARHQPHILVFERQ